MNIMEIEFTTVEEGNDKTWQHSELITNPAGVEFRVFRNEVTPNQWLYYFWTNDYKSGAKPIHMEHMEPVQAQCMLHYVMSEDYGKDEDA